MADQDNNYVRRYEDALALLDSDRMAEGLAEMHALWSLGIMRAGVAVGWAHHFGRGVPRDLREAERWYLSPAQAGDELGQYHLACVYLEEQRWKDAIHWLEEAAQKGHTSSLYRLGLVYKAGVGVAKDEERAYRLFEAASEGGQVFAQRELAIGLLRGRQGIRGVFRGIRLFLMVPRLLYRAAAGERLDDRHYA